MALEPVDEEVRLVELRQEVRRWAAYPHWLRLGSHGLGIAVLTALTALLGWSTGGIHFGLVCSAVCFGVPVFALTQGLGEFLIQLHNGRRQLQLRHRLRGLPTAAQDRILVALADETRPDTREAVRGVLTRLPFHPQRVSLLAHLKGLAWKLRPRRRALRPAVIGGQGVPLPESARPPPTAWAPAAVSEIRHRVTGALLRSVPGATLAGADLRVANLQQAYLRGADLRGADLRMADLRNADLKNARLDGALMQGSNARGADLRFAWLPGADLRGADFWGARLDRALLADADLEGASLWGARLESADLRRARLQAADLRQALLLRATLDGATYDAATRWSRLDSRFSPEKARCVLVEPATEVVPAASPGGRGDELAPEP